MTLKAQMQADANVFVNPDEFGVTCILTLDGADNSINVILGKEIDPDTGRFFDAVSLKKVDMVGLKTGDVFTIEGKAYNTVTAKPLFEDDVFGTIRVSL